MGIIKVQKFLLTLFTLFMVSSCNFESGSEESSGGGLFSGHKSAENLFLLIPPTDATYTEGQNIDLVLRHSHSVTVTGNPRVAIDLGGSTVHADYLTGTGTENLTFRYTIQAGDDDLNGISISSTIDLNGGSINFSNAGVVTAAEVNYTTISTSDVKVDTTAPSIALVTPPIPNTYLINQQIQFVVVFNDVVIVSGAPRIQMDVGGVTQYAEYAAGSNSTTLMFRYTVGATDVDNDGISITSPIDLNGGAIADNVGNNASLTFTPIPMPTTLVDGDTPLVSVVNIPTSKTYVNGELITMSLEFSEIVNITGTPRIQFNIGTDSKFLNYDSGSGTNTIVFDYLVVPGDDDNNGITLGNIIDLNGGTIQDAGTTNAQLSFSSPLSPGVLVDAGIPEVISINPPIDNTYIVSNEMFFTLNFDKIVNITGTPRIPIQLNSSAPGFIYADYISGTGSQAIVFRYAVQNGDLDLDGIAIQNALELNGGTIQGVNSINANLDIATPVGAINTTGILIDAAPPSVTALTNPVDNNYTTGNNIDFVVTFSKSVDVINTPRIQLDIGGNTVFANYLSGTGTNALTFRYVVQALDMDSDGIAISNNSIDLNGTGTIRDTYGNNATLDMTAFIAAMPNVQVNYSPVTITSITPPTDATYNETNNIDFVVNTSENVNATGTPRISIDIGGTTKYADYLSGTGTNALTFRYVVEAGLLDNDGITISSPLELNGGTIQNGSAQNLDLTFSPPTMTNVLVDSQGPIISSITPPADATYDVGQNLDFVANIDENVNVTGTPRIQIDIGGTTKYADYLSGTGTNALTFRYVVEIGLYDNDGITISSPMDLNGGTIQNAGLENLTLTFTPPVMTNVLVDSRVPTISSITPPADATYDVGQNLDFVANISENVNVTGTPRIQIDIGGTTKYADYLSGTGTNALTFRYVVEVGLLDNDGITISSPMDLNGGTIQNAGLENLDLTFTPPTMTNVLVDSMPPVISSITPPADATYIETNNIDFVANIDQNVNVTGTPRIQIDIGGVTKYADYLSGTGTNALTFRYVVEAGLTDNDGITISSPMELNGGTIQNAALENLDLTFTPPTMTNVLVDSQGPAITSITPPTDATYIETNNMDFIANIDEVVNVTGTPRIQLDIGGVTKYADYLSGTGSNALTFRYVVEASLSDLDGITLVQPLDLNGGTVQNAGLENLDLTFTPPTTTNVLVDSTDPTVAITNPADNSYINIANDSATFTVSGTCDENGQVVTIEVDAGPATSPSGFACNGTTFAGTIDTTGLTPGAHTLVAKLSDPAANEGVSTTINVTKDMVAPTISSVTPPINNFYILGANLDFIVNLDENTDVTGTPRIQLDINGVTRNADYLSGTGTNALTFRYTVISEEDLDGIGFFSSTIDLNGGTLLDVAGNPINLNLDATVALPNLSSVLVDGVIPTVAITSSPNINSANEATYSASGTCSENGRTVLVDLDTISVSPPCIGGAWTTGAIDVSARPDNPAFPITADHSDAAGNNATQATTSVDKNTATPMVAITFALNITSANHTAYSVSGTCTQNGVMVDVNIGTINIQPNCSGGTWTTGNVDVSSLADNPSISITADHSTATQASTTVSKDTASPIVTISSSPNINLSNETSYIASGTCSENGVMVDINIGTLNFTPNCNSGSWTTGTVDVSSLADSGSISFTADHSTAPQASTTISKNTSTPTISSLSIPTTLANSADMSWSLNDPGGFTINDYEVNYRVKGSPTWLSFADGVSINTTATITGLLASTTYEFRVRVQYDTSNYSDWSNTAEGETKPDDPLFNSPYAAMNVGGATSTSVVAYYDNTVVTLNGTPIADSPLSKGQTSIITTAQFDVIDGDKPIFTAGILGSGNGGSGANMVWMPTAWAGKSFSFNATRANPQNLFVYATENATVTVKQGATVLDTIVLTAGNGGTLNWSVYGSYQVTSTGTILAYHMSGSGTTRYDPKPIMPGHTSIIGFPSNSMRLTADLDATNYNLVHSDSTIASGNLNKQDVIQVNPEGGTTTLYRSESLIISADRKVSGASFADSNGLCAAPFLPTNLMKTRYVINAQSDYVAFASTQSGTIDVYTSAQTIGVDPPSQTLTLTRTGANANAPYKARLGGTITAGTRFVSSVPAAGWYHPSVELGSAARDETILYGTND